MDAEISVSVSSQNSLGEGVMWSDDEQSVYWVDIDKAELWSYEPHSGSASTRGLEDAICSFAFREQGGMIVARTRSIELYDPRTGEGRKVRDVIDEPEGMRLNDGRCDRQGRFVVGGLDEKHGRRRAEVFSTDARLEPRSILDGIGCSNSTCFSIDGRTMYFADTPEQVIWQFEYDLSDGTPHDRRIFCDLRDQGAKPDGSTIDAEGFLWNAQWEGSRIVRYDPKGRVDRVIELPCRYPTCIAFGGESHDVLYVTSARRASPGAEDGSLLAISCGVRGLPESKFAG